MTRQEYEGFKRGWIYRGSHCLWFAGLIVGIPGQLFTALVLHDRVKASDLFIASIICYVPFLIILNILIVLGMKERKRLQLKLIVLETLQELADPELRRKANIESVKELFK